MTNSNETAKNTSRVSQQLPEQSQEGSRLTALQIFTAAAHTGEEELKRSTTGLALSGLAAGLEMGLTALGSAVIVHATGAQGPMRDLLAALLYPLGFIVVVLGRAQLFTENTLFPVMLVLDRRRHIGKTLRLWAVVFSANVLGTLAFAALMTQTPALSPGLIHTMAELGRSTVAGGVAHAFWSGIAGGWIIALMAWLVTASRYLSGQLLLVYLTTFVVGAAGLAHCIAGSAEALSGVLAGTVAPGTYLLWLAGATFGNTVGGVFMVSVLNYGQVIGSGQDAARARRQLDDIDSRAAQEEQ